MISFLDLATLAPVEEHRLEIEWVTSWLPAPILNMELKKEYVCLPGTELWSIGSSCRGLVTMLTVLFLQVFA